MKKYILSILALMAISFGATAQTLTQVWKTTSIPVGSVWGGDARQGVGVNGVFYINNANTHAVEAYGKDGLIESYSTGDGWGITSDDAGNIISRVGFINNATGVPAPAGPMRSDTIQINIIPAGSSNVINVSFESIQNLAEARADYFGHAYGDVVNGTGYLIITQNGESKPYAIAFDHGQVDPSKSLQLNTTKELMGFATQSTLSFSYVDKSGAQHATLMVRNGGQFQDLTLDMNNGVLGSNILDVKDVSVNRGADAGGEIFMLGDSLYAVYPLKDSTGSYNYLDGFEIANITSDEEGPVVVATVANTYQAEQNKGAGNWITVEHVNDTLVNLYNFYVNGFVAMYTFSIPGVSNNALQLNFKDATDSVVILLTDEPGYEFSTDGTQMTVYKGATAVGTAHNVSNIASLMYTLVDHKHTLTLVADTVLPTDEVPGHLAYWECTGTTEDAGCHLYFADSLGTQEIGNADSLAAWLAEGGEGFLPCVYDSTKIYAIIGDTLIVRTDRISEMKNVVEDSLNYFHMTYTRLGEQQTFETEAVNMGEVVFKKGDRVDPWEYLGIGSYTEGLFYSLYGDDPITVDVEVYEDKVYKGRYMFRGHALPIAADFWYADEAEMKNYEGQYWVDTEIVIDATDSTNVIWPRQLFGVKGDLQLGLFEAFSISGGTLSNGEITWPVKGFYIYVDGTPKYYGNYNGETKLVLPSAKGPKAPKRVAAYKADDAQEQIVLKQRAEFVGEPIK